MSPRISLVTVALIVAGILVLAQALSAFRSSQRAPFSRSPPPGGLPVAVLGDSDSHAYGDSIWLPADRRGGEEFHAVTLQWTEILDRVRPEEIDLGPWGVWGTRYRWVLLRRMLNLPARYPVKLDFRYNLAISGARCSELRDGRGRQLPPLLSMIREDPERWSDGVVVIRIGINSLSSHTQLSHYATVGLDSVSRGWVQDCLDYIESTTRDVLAANPGTRIALVGIAEDINGASHADLFESAEAVRGIQEVLDHFDNALRALAEAEPRVAFVGDRAWWIELWGGRDDSGTFRPRAVSLGGAAEVTNTIGDHPSNAVLDDGHAGTVVNGLWANELIRVLNEEFGLGLTPLSLAEIGSLADPDGSYGLTPVPGRSGSPSHRDSSRD